MSEQTNQSTEIPNKVLKETQNSKASEQEIIQATLTNYFDQVALTKSNKAKYLAVKNEFKILSFDGKKVTQYERKLIKNKDLRAIQKLRYLAVNYEDNNLKGRIKVGDVVYDNPVDMHYDSQRLLAKHGLGIIDDDEYENLAFEDFDDKTENDEWGLRSVLDGVLLRAVHGSSFFHQPSNNA